METNGLGASATEYHSTARPAVDLTDPRLARVTRLRLLSDPGYPVWDLSYCHGELRDGTPVRVTLPWHQFSKRHLSRDLVTMAREAGVYAKGLGLLDSTSLMN